MEPRPTQPCDFEDDESELIGQGFAKRLGDVLYQLVACCGRAGRRERLDVGRRGWDLHGESRLDASTRSLPAWRLRHHSRRRISMEVGPTLQLV